MKPRCICSYHLTLEEDLPAPFGLAWAEGHKVSHLLMFPEADADTRAQLDLQIEAERVRAVGV